MSAKPLGSLRSALVLLAVAAVSACGSSGGVGGSGQYGERLRGLECAPFARELSGLALYGEAADWWDGASGRYARTREPVVGGVLVFRRSDRLPSGHVSVVSARLGARQIQVMQANWVRNELDQDQLVVDVSEHNDWTAVRVWYPPVGQLGTHVYEAYGFVVPPAAVTHDELARASRTAAVIAVGSRYGRPVPRARSYGF